MSKSKEEILKNACEKDQGTFLSDGVIDGHTDDVYEAMDEYAKQEAIAWSIFLDEGHWRKNKKSTMWFNNNFVFIEEEELYTLFTQSKNEIK